MKASGFYRPAVCVFAAAISLSLFAVTALAKAPSFDCSKASTEIEQTICQDDELSALDRKLAHVYSEASRRYPTTAPPRLRQEHIAWEQKLDACAAKLDKRECIQTAYMTRIAEVQATNDLVSGKAQTFHCKNGSGTENSLLATFHQTDPPTATLQRGDERVLAILNQSPNNARYEGTNVSFQHGADKVRVVWVADEMSCSAE
jgi:uncharacterized protein